MKRITSILIAAVLTCSLAACNHQQPSASDGDLSSYLSTDLSDSSVETNPSQNTDSSVSQRSDDSKTSDNILIVYFSRWGNTEYSNPDQVDVSTSASIVMDSDPLGTTEYVARMIQEAVGGDLHFIQTATPYTEDFDELRTVNHNEMENHILPELKKSDLDLSAYDTVFIGYPVWATDVPQAVLSFLNEYDLSEKTVIPFCTHDGYGAGNSYNTIYDASKSTRTLDGLALESTEVSGAKSEIADWLNAIGISTAQNLSTTADTTAIQITIGDTVLDGILYDTELAREIQAQFPLTVSMVGYGGREYYGGVEFSPEHTDGGQLYFENGEITYCDTNHSMAIFYAQTDRPNLTMEVIPIGKVTSDLAVFDSLGSREEITFSIAESK